MRAILAFAASSTLLFACSSGRDAPAPLPDGAVVDGGGPRPMEPCDGVDNDRDPTTPDGSGDDRYRAECPSTAPGACGRFEWVCASATWACRQIYGPAAAPVTLTEAVAGDQDSATIAWDGEAFVIGFITLDGGVSYMRIDLDGAILAGPISLDPLLSGFVSITTRPDGEALAIWSRANAIRYARLTRDGAIVASGTLLDVTPTPSWPVVATRADGHLVAYTTGTSEAQLPYALAIDLDAAPRGAPLELGTSPVSGASIGREIVVTATSSGYAAVWGDAAGTQLRMVDPTGAPTGSTIAIGPAGVEPGVSSTGDAVGASWTEWTFDASGHPTGEGRLSFQVIDAAGATIGTSIDVTAGMAPPMGTSATTIGPAFGALWQGNRSDQDDVYLAQLRPNGTGIDWKADLFCSGTPSLLEAARAVGAPSTNGEWVGVLWKALGELHYIKVCGTACGLI